MTVRMLVPLCGLNNADEQSSLNPRTVTGTGQSRPCPEMGQFQKAGLFLNVTAIAGAAPSVTFKVQVQNPLSLAWVDLPNSTFPAVTATGESTPLFVDLIGHNYRGVWTFGGTTTSITFNFSASCMTEEPPIPNDDL